MYKRQGLKKEDMAFTLATGYGRTSLMDGIADKQMSELSCHAKGAYFLFPKVHTVIDIGGQDVKVLRVEDGVMTNFQMNDKCAAGTGRFLDVMARVLEVEVSDLGPVSYTHLDVYKRQAMKMETEIVAPADGTVAQILVKAGDAVDTGAALVTLN